MAKLGGMSASAFLMAKAPTALADTFAGTFDNVSTKPSHHSKILDSSELGVGEPSKYIPKASILKAAFNRPDSSASPIQAWIQLLTSLKDADAETQIAAVHGFFNQVRYVGEQGQDVWKLPAQFLCEGGDCEDFAIAKFVSLRLLGFHKDRIRLVFVENTLTGADHAVTAVQYNDKTYILDNNLANVTLSDKLGHYNPVCSFDEKRLWLHWKSGNTGGSVASLQQRLSKQS
ncbi:MAG: hypothetical protein EYC62_01865 [Alphaproteobacteria bacterium]|nr:MAG: hypothetical protein EYC62_01865 [Alphaproteobacteria bacterium]